MDGSRAEVEVERPEDMLNEVEARILKELKEIERTVIDRGSPDTACCQLAFLGRLMSRRDTLLRRCAAERRRA